MPIKLAVTGKPKSGKTTAILKLVDFLKRNGIKVGGFYTVEVRKNGNRIGFDVINILNDRQVVLARINEQSNIKVGKYFVKLEGLEEIGIKSLEDDFENFQIIIIDEVGPMELKSQLFRKMVHQLIDGDKPTVFTVHFKLEDKLVKEVKTKSKLYELTTDNRNRIALDLTYDLKIRLGLK